MKRRGGVSEQFACCCTGVLSKALPPHLHPRPSTHLPARHQPYLTRSDTLFPQLRAPLLGSATHRLQSTAVCVGERVCPSANSALSFKQICPDCPRTKLTSLPTASQTHFAGQTGKVFSSLYSTSQFTQQI